MRNSVKVLAATAAIGVAVLGSTSAKANPITFYYSVNGGAVTQIANNASSIDGSATASLTGTMGLAAYSFTMTGTGTPFLPSPDFQSTTLNIVTTGAGTLTIYAVESGLTATSSLSGFQLGYTNNLGSSLAVTEGFGIISGTAISPSTTTFLNSTVVPINSTSTAFVSAGTLPSTFSVVEAYQATFTGTGGTINATISESGVPEPMSMSLLGVGLAGLGLVRLHRKARS